MAKRILEDNNTLYSPSAKRKLDDINNMLNKMKLSFKQNVVPALRCLEVDEKSAAKKFITVHRTEVMNQIVEVHRSLESVLSSGQLTLRGREAQILNLKEQLKIEKEKVCLRCVGNDLLSGVSFEDAMENMDEKDEQEGNSSTDGGKKRKKETLEKSRNTRESDNAQGEPSDAEKQEGKTDGGKKKASKNNREVDDTQGEPSDGKKQERDTDGGKKQKKSKNNREVDDTQGEPSDGENQEGDTDGWKKHMKSKNNREGDNSPSEPSDGEE